MPLPLRAFHGWSFRHGVSIIRLRPRPMDSHAGALLVGSHGKKDGTATMTSQHEHRTKLGETLEISKVLTGLWQVADIEKDGNAIDPETGADALEAYLRAGFDTFDMADHYGSAEIIAGRLLARAGAIGARPVICTKWCPTPGPMTADVVRAGVADRLERLGADRVDLLQFHWWSFDHPGWLDALHEMTKLREEGLIGEIGVTNFDAAHLNLALADGIPVVTNQVPFSLIDRRAAGPLLHVASRWGVHLLAYGTLAGGFLSDRWAGAAAPCDVRDWSKMKYRRFIEAAGGWARQITPRRTHGCSTSRSTMRTEHFWKARSRQRAPCRATAATNTGNLPS